MILVTGATGLNGRALLQRLSARGVPARALVQPRQGRDALRPAEARDRGGRHGAARHAGPGPARRRPRDAHLLLGPRDARRPVELHRRGPQGGGGPRRQALRDHARARLPFRFARMHGEIERRLEASGMAFTHLRAGEFMPSYFRQVPSIIARGALFLPMENAKIASIDIGDIADVAAVALTDSGHEGKIYPLTGPEALTMAEVAEKLSAVAGKPIRYVNVAPEDAKKAQLAAGASAYLADALAELFAERRKGKEASASPAVQMILGRPPVSFDAFARRNAAIFRGEQPAPKI